MNQRDEIKYQPWQPIGALVRDVVLSRMTFNQRMAVKHRIWCVECQIKRIISEAHQASK